MTTCIEGGVEHAEMTEELKLVSAPHARTAATAGDQFRSLGKNATSYFTLILTGYFVRTSLFVR